MCTVQFMLAYRPESGERSKSKTKFYVWTYSRPRQISEEVEKVMAAVGDVVTSETESQDVMDERTALVAKLRKSATDSGNPIKQYEQLAFLFTKGISATAKETFQRMARLDLDKKDQAFTKEDRKDLGIFKLPGGFGRCAPRHVYQFFVDCKTAVNAVELGEVVILLLLDDNTGTFNKGHLAVVVESMESKGTVTVVYHDDGYNNKTRKFETHLRTLRRLERMQDAVIRRDAKPQKVVSEKSLLYPPEFKARADKKKVVLSRVITDLPMLHFICSSEKVEVLAFCWHNPVAMSALVAALNVEFLLDVPKRFFRKSAEHAADLAEQFEDNKTEKPEKKTKKKADKVDDKEEDEKKKKSSKEKKSGKKRQASSSSSSRKPKGFDNDTLLEDLLSSVSPSEHVDKKQRKESDQPLMSQILSVPPPATPVQLPPVAMSSSSSSSSTVIDDDDGLILE